MTDTLAVAVRDETVEPAVFKFGDQEIRAFEKNGEVWFVGPDICRVLGIKQPARFVKGLDDDQRMVNKVHTLGGLQTVTMISESGFYTAVIRSNKPEARDFRRWATGEVLPAIRRTGQYQTAPDSRGRTGGSAIQDPATVTSVEDELTFRSALGIGFFLNELHRKIRETLTILNPDINKWEGKVDFNWEDQAKHGSLNLTRYASEVMAAIGKMQEMARSGVVVKADHHIIIIAPETMTIGIDGNNVKITAITNYACLKDKDIQNFVTAMEAMSELKQVWINEQFQVIKKRHLGMWRAPLDRAVNGLQVLETICDAITANVADTLSRDSEKPLKSAI